MSTTRPLQLDTVAIETLSVAIRCMRVGRKQMTQSIFRQLPRETLVNGEGACLGTPWGFVNYFWDCGVDEEHLHAVWQHGTRLCRDCLPADAEDSAIGKAFTRRVQHQRDDLWRLAVIAHILHIEQGAPYAKHAMVSWPCDVMIEVALDDPRVNGWIAPFWMNVLRLKDMRNTYDPTAYTTSRTSFITRAIPDEQERTALLADPTLTQVAVHAERHARAYRYALDALTRYHTGYDEALEMIEQAGQLFIAV